jgi:hypothetical protein
LQKDCDSLHQIYYSRLSKKYFAGPTSSINLAQNADLQPIKSDAYNLPNFGEGIEP